MNNCDLKNRILEIRRHLSQELKWALLYNSWGLERIKSANTAINVLEFVLENNLSPTAYSQTDAEKLLIKEKVFFHKFSEPEDEDMFLYGKDDAFFQTPVTCRFGYHINLNDTLYPGAYSEFVSKEDCQELYKWFKKYGHDGITWFYCKKHNVIPYKKKMREAYLEIEKLENGTLKEKVLTWVTRNIKTIKSKFRK